MDDCHAIGSLDLIVPNIKARLGFAPHAYNEDAKKVCEGSCDDT